MLEETPQFNGEMLSSGNLTYMRARNYDSTIGQFTSKDTWLGRQTNPLSQNRNTFVENNPVNAIDPSGKEFVIAGAATITAGITIMSSSSGKTEYESPNKLQLKTETPSSELDNVSLDGVTIEVHMDKKGLIHGYPIN